MNYAFHPSQPVATCVAYLNPAVGTTVARVSGRYENQKSWNRVREEIWKLRLMHYDWDGDGSNAPARGLIDTAIRISEYLEKINSPVPTTAVATRAGTILFAWRLGRAYQEIDVVEPYRVEWMTVAETGAPTHGELGIPPEPPTWLPSDSNRRATMDVHSGNWNWF